MADWNAPKVPRQEAAPGDVLSSENTTGVTLEVETEAGKEARAREAANRAKKENVPLRRGVAVKCFRKLAPYISADGV
jgi:hypothetical protein